MAEVYISGFDTLRRGADTVFIRPDWKRWVLSDLFSDFRDVRDRKVYPHGRVEHFSYRPGGAPDRVLVRRAIRGGFASVMHDLYIGFRRPLREIQASAAAERSGVNVPSIVAAKATRVAGLFYRFTIVMKEIPEASNLLSMAPRLAPAEKRAAIERLAEEIRRLHEAGIYHADLTVRNILISERDIYVIDLDKARMRKDRDEDSVIENLARLNRSIEKWFAGQPCITRADKVRFLRKYHGTRDGLRELARRCAAGLWLHRFWWSLRGEVT